MTSQHIISLIGFPGSGKSTVGVLLAKRLGTAFVDTDILIQTQENATLAEIIARSDHHQLRKIEEQVLLDMPITTGVISTGDRWFTAKKSCSDSLLRQLLFTCKPPLRRLITGFPSPQIAGLPRAKTKPWPTYIGSAFHSTSSGQPSRYRWTTAPRKLLCPIF